MGQMVKMTIKEAADKLLEKGAITAEECELIKESAVNWKGLGEKAVKGLTMVGMTGLGIGTLQSLLTPVVNRVQSEMAFKKMTEKVPTLKEKDPEKIKDYFKVVQTFSPKAATNPLVAGAIVNKMVEFGGVDHKLVQDISSIQNALPLSTELTGAAAKKVMSGHGMPPSEVTTDQAGNVTSTKTFVPAG